MKNTIIKNWCKKLWMLCAFTCLAWAAGAQINIHVTVLPPYYTHFTDYSSHPQQIMILVTNTSDKGKDIQLRGSITGDNGVEISVEKNFKNSSPLHVDAGATRTLNGNDINSLFDFNQLVYTGITRDKLMLQGNLPEGNYQVCVRAYDYSTNVPLSDDQPTGCSNTFPVSSVEPPTIIKPTDGDALPTAGGQNFVITWSTPAGALPTTQYTVSIAEVLDNRSPQVAMMSATNPMFYQATVTGTNVLLYNTAMPALTQGRRYAMMVTAKDPTNKITFRNNGQSEVIGFVYGDVNLPPDNGNVAGGVVCSCAVPLPVNGQASTNIAPGGVITAGNFSITVLSVFKNNNNTLSGTGKVNLPVANSGYIPVGVSFNNIQINSSNQLIRGVINAQVKSDVNFLPTVPGSNPNLMPFSPSDITSLSNYIDRNVSNTVSQLKSTAANTVFQLPIGLDKSLLGSPVTIEVTALTITPTQAVMDAATIINTPDDNVVSRIALGAKNICVNPTDLCGDAKLFLAADVNLPSLNLTLKGAGSPDGGSYVVFDKSGFKSLQISADMALPQSLIVKLSDRASPVTAHFSVNTTNGWSDWMAQVKIDPFAIAGNNDFGFIQLGDATYDHSDIQNPAALPSIPEKPELTTPQWHGFYLPKLAVNLPAVLKTAQGQPITAAVQNLIIDGNGVSGNLAATNLLQIGDGSLGGWYYSIDNLGITIVNNGFKNGGMDGKLVLPVSDVNQKSAQLNYHSTLSNGANGSGIQFQFVMAPKNDLNFAIWAATAQIDQTSNITVVAGGGNSFSAKATLNGHLSIDANLPVVGKVNFAQMKFEQFKLTTDNPYVDFGNTTFKLASPQHTIGGNTTGGDNMGFAPPASGDMGDFPVTLTNVSPYFADGKIGVKFTMGLTLADIAALPTATTTLSIYGKVKLDGARPKFFFDPGDAVHLDEITVNGDLGAVHIDGKVAFYNNDATYGNGFKGTVTAKFPAIDIGVGSTIQFGSFKGYKYWYVDALVDLGQAGIVLGNTGMSIFGFGGGAYYHMHQSLNLPGASVLANAPKPGSGPSSSGITYTPDVNVALGLKATILFGLNARPVFNADATMGIEFNAAGGLNAITFNGNGRMLDAPPKPAVIVTLNAEYVFPTSTFSARATAVMDYPPLNLPTDIKGSGSLDIYFAPGKYYIKFGTPSSPIRFPYYMLNNNSFYLEAGNFDIDNMPPPPTNVLTVLRKSNIDISKFNDPTSDGAVSGGSGFIIGGAAGFDYKGQFAIFKADFGATVGFDMALKKYGADADIKCSNGQTSIGQDGWYATGQVYAGVWGNIDISTDFFGDINVLDVGAGAELKGGTPNPTFVTGAIGGYFSVLDGLISGELHYEFSSGQATCDVAQDALSDFKLISDITPSEGTDNSKADVTIEPAVAFNYKLAASVNDNPSFSVLQSNGKDAKNAVRRYFRFNQNCVSAGLTDNDRKTPVASSQFVSQDGKGIAVGPLRTLAKTTNYTFTVSAHLEELINGTWVTAKYSTGAKKGQDYIDTRTVSFKTNKGLDSITDNMVEYTYPLKMQRYFMPEEASTTYYGTGNAVIKVRQVVDPLSLNMPGAESGYEQSFYAKLVPIMPTGAARTFDFSLTADATGKISFALPNDLAANTIYAIQFIGAWTPKSPLGGAPKKTGVTQGAFAFTRLSNLATYRAALGSYSNDTVHNTKLGDKIALKGNEKQLYLIYFKTGTYKKFAEKVVQMPITSLEFAISGAPGADSYTLSVADLDDMKNKGVDLDAYIAGKMHLAAKTVTVNYTKSVYFGGKEYFDNYDILGYNNVKVAEMDGVIYPFKVTPLVSVDNANTVSWLSQFAYTLKSYYKIDKIFGDRTWYNYYTGGATYTLTKMDGKNVGNITLDMINGGVDPVSAYGQVSTFSAPLRSRIGGILRLPVALPPSYILKAGFEPVWKSGHGLSRPHNGINDIAEFKQVYGGDPAPDALSQIGVVYDLGISTFKQNASVQGGTITATYQLPGSIGAKTSVSSVFKAPAISLNFGKMAAVGARH